MTRYISVKFTLNTLFSFAGQLIYRIPNVTRMKIYEWHWFNNIFRCTYICVYVINVYIFLSFPSLLSYIHIFLRIILSHLVSFCLVRSCSISFQFDSIHCIIFRAMPEWNGKNFDIFAKNREVTEAIEYTYEYRHKHCSNIIVINYQRSICQMDHSNRGRSSLGTVSSMYKYERLLNYDKHCESSSSTERYFRDNQIFLVTDVWLYLSRRRSKRWLHLVKYL